MFLRSIGHKLIANSLLLTSLFDFPNSNYKHSKSVALQFSTRPNNALLATAFMEHQSRASAPQQKLVQARYVHFNSKEQLIAGICERDRRQFADSFQYLANAEDTITALGQLAENSSSKDLNLSKVANI